MPSMHHVLAIDAGTTGDTCLMVREDGQVSSRGYREVTQFFPQPGWVEHDPDQIFDATLAAAREALARAKSRPVSIGITNQRETAVVWNRETGRPLQRAIVWQDRRTTARCTELRGQAGDRITALTGLMIDPYFSATKFEWILRENRSLGNEARARLALGTVDAWLIWKLTGGAVFATDPTNASRTMLYDINAQTWSDEL